MDASNSSQLPFAGWAVRSAEALAEQALEDRRLPEDEMLADALESEQGRTNSKRSICGGCIGS